MDKNSSLKESVKHGDIEEIIVRVLDQRQSEDDMHHFLAWYHAKEENRELFFQIKDIYERRAGGLYPNVREIRASWERLRNRRPVGSPRRILCTLVAAVALVLIVSGVYFYFQNREEIRWVEVRTTPRSAPRAISLSDGSTVLLNASSWLKYPEKFRGKSREVFLDGEACFTVSRDEKRKFIVHTDQQEIHVLGTRFNVQGYSSDPYTVTTLITGKVKLATHDRGNLSTSELTMRPNQQVYFDKQRNETAVSQINPDEVVTWMKGVYSFRDASLEEITGRLGRVMGIVFVIPDESDRIEKYTGKFFSDQTPEEIAGVLNFNGQFRSEFRNDTLFLLNR